MQLNRDCVRFLLLTVESSEFNKTLWLHDICNHSNMISYSEETVIYTIQKLLEAKFINGNILYASNQPYAVSIGSLTWDGHQFLDNIRDPNIWENVKSKSSKLKSISLPLLAELGLSLVKEQLGLN